MEKKSYLCTTKLKTLICFLHRGVEQLVARQAHNLEVACSSPASATHEIRLGFPKRILLITGTSVIRVIVQKIVILFGSIAK